MSVNLSVFPYRRLEISSSIGYPEFAKCGLKGVESSESSLTELLPVEDKNPNRLQNVSNNRQKPLLVKPARAFIYLKEFSNSAKIRLLEEIYKSIIAVTESEGKRNLSL